MSDSNAGTGTVESWEGAGGCDVGPRRGGAVVRGECCSTWGDAKSVVSLFLDNLGTLPSGGTH